MDIAINEWRKHLCACVHTKGQYFKYFLQAVGQLDKLSAKVTEIWKQ